MTSNHPRPTPRYTLSRRTKHTCPACGKRRFVRYVDTTTGEFIPEQYGRCDREDRCGYYLNPYKDGWVKDQPLTTGPVQALPPRVVTFIPQEVLDKTRNNPHEGNTFLNNLHAMIPEPDVQAVADLYRLGTVTHGYRSGGVTFPFIDEQDRCRAIQVKTFDDQNHTTGTDFIHSIIERWHKERGRPVPSWIEHYAQNDLKVSCLFGAHLLSAYPRNRVALTEAPKTAIYGALWYGLPESDDDLLWLAAYNVSAISVERMRVLSGRTVYLFPDLSVHGLTWNEKAAGRPVDSVPDYYRYGRAFREWCQRMEKVVQTVPGIKYTVSDYLERIGTTDQREAGWDLADMLASIDYKKCRGTLR